MQISPRYDGSPVIELDVPPADIRTPFLRQRRRLLATLASLDDDGWRHQSRCDAWTTHGVVTHLVSTDGFWGISLASGLAGEPTRFLQGFDPQASPAALVESKHDVPWTETLDEFRAATERLCETVEELTDDDLVRLAEAPPGHVSVAAVLHHALWDCWVHERDITVPLGLAPAPEDDEVVACLRYALALAPAFGIVHGDPDRRGVLGLDVTGPAAAFHATIDGSVVVREGPAPGGAPTLTGDALELLEALSTRTALEHDLGADDRWMVEGLLTVFDR